MLQHNRQESSPTPALKTSFFRAVARTVKSYKLGDLLVASGVITPRQLETALAEQKKSGGQLGAILIHHKALTAVQLYQKLAEQWCIKASAAGLAVLMQTTLPVATARADEQINDPDGMTAQFTLVSAAHASASRHYPELFGTHETQSNDITAFRKWTEVMGRFENQLKSLKASSPRVMLWKAEIRRLRDKSPREKIEGINRFLNQVAYIEDIDNYGKTDYWATPVEFLSRGGDCEDFAIAKYASLRALGFSSDQLRVAIVQDKIKNIPHAVLIVYSDEGNYVLDNQDKKVEAITAVNRYQPIFSINSTSWWKHSA
jgi:predicted transglutaminase-like cysteine proteinase